MRLQLGGDPLLMMEMAQQMGQVGQEGCITGQAVCDNGFESVFEPMQMNPDPGTHRGGAGVCQIGIDGNMGGPVQDHEPVVPTPFDFEPFLIHIDDVRLNAAMDLLADRSGVLEGTDSPALGASSASK